MKRYFLLTILQIASLYLPGQADTIRLRNSSFEDTPKRGGEALEGIAGWFDCGRINFPAETPPDIHPNGYWENNLPASDKKTYLGMVVRDNATYESVSQRLRIRILQRTRTAGRIRTHQQHLMANQHL